MPRPASKKKNPVLNLMGLCSLHLIFLTVVERITFGGAVDRSAGDRAVDLAASARFWGLGAEGPGPGTQVAPRDPGSPPLISWAFAV